MIKKKKWEFDLSVDIDTIWDFFSNPENLNRLTPEEVDFKINFVSNSGNMYPGMIIHYKIGPFPLKWISFSWVAEIKQIKNKEYFIDEQRYGPFSFWHHEHRFQKLEEKKVKIIDILSYKVPLGILGHLVDHLIIDKLINRMFNDRKKFLEKIFNSNV